MRIERSREWWLRLAQSEPDLPCIAGAPDAEEVRGPHNGWLTRAEQVEHLGQLAKLKARP